MFEYKIKVRIFDTDPAGLIFFANIFRISHIVFEEFLNKNNISITDLMLKLKLFPVAVHSEADYLKGIHLGDLLIIRANVTKITKSTFIMQYIFYRDDSEPVAIVKSRHAAISPDTGHSIRLPEILLSVLKKYL